jgi:flagellar motor switch protein FliN
MADQHEQEFEGQKSAREGDEGMAKPLDGTSAGEPASPIEMIGDVNLNVRIELGRSKMAIEDILKLQTGSVVTLDKLAGDFVDVYVNDRLVARGEVLVLNDTFCVRIAEVVSHEDSPKQTP